MKKTIVILSMTLASLLFLSSTGRGDLSELGDRIKRAACERACQRTYESCMKSSGDAVNREDQSQVESDISEVTRGESCQYAKEKCLENCE